MHVATYVPSCLDLVEVRDIMFYPLRELETGLIVDAAVPGGKIVIKGSLFSTIGDSPQQAVNTHSKGTSGVVHCVACFHTQETICRSDEVSPRRQCTIA